MKIAIDIGGTFTDVLVVDKAGSLTSTKRPTRPDDLSGSFLASVSAALEAAGAPGRAPTEMLYSTTLALNSLLTHRLPRVGLIVNRGFRELLETARLPARNGDTAAHAAPLPGRLIPLELVGEVGARMEADGSVRTAVNEAEVVALAHGYRDNAVEYVAVSLLHSYVDASHEHQIGEILKRAVPGLGVVLSCEVLPELREYERTLAACLNACLMAPMRKHVERVLDASAGTPLYIMKSSGGLSSARATLRKPLATVLSGPSAGVVGTRWLGDQMGLRNLIALDVGGTSTDVALVRDGHFAMTTEGEIAGFPMKTPMIDVFSIGAGGGSIATEGVDGRWRVGPESAGAAPGPVCYRRGGDRVTLTDAQLVLGRLPEALLGGELPLDLSAARRALHAFAAPRGLDAGRAARGILEIATHNMCGAIRRVSVLRGHDPKGYALMAMGGAGPLHAAELASLLGIQTVVVPPQPGLAAAFGLLVADLREDFVKAFGHLDAAVDVTLAAEMFEELRQAADRFLAGEGVAPAHKKIRRSIDMRYAGMLYEANVALGDEPLTRATLDYAVEAFHVQFERSAGHSHRGQEAVELVNLRLGAVGEREKLTLPRRPDSPASVPEPRSKRDVGFLGQRALLATPVYERSGLPIGTALQGPALIEQYESTIVVPPGFGAVVDGFGNVLLRPSGGTGEWER